MFAPAADRRPVNAGPEARSVAGHSGPAAARSLAWHLLVALLLLAGLVLVNQPSFLLFHSFAEIFNVVIAVSTGLVAWNARKYVDNHYLVFLGIGQSFVAVIDVLHMLAYKGMGVFANGGPGLSTQLWIAGRYLGSISLVAATLFIRRRTTATALIGGFTVVTALLIASVFTGYFPVCYDVALTPFKVFSEFLIAFLYAASGWLLYRHRRAFDTTVLNLILLSIALRVVAEICFAVYWNVYDVLSFTGHYLRIVAFYLLYKAIFVTGIVRPYAILMRDLRQREADLSKSVQELEAFSYSVSHDLRSPVAAIAGFAQLLEWQEGGRLSTEALDYVSQIRRSTRRMTELIDDLLAFSRATRSDVEVAPVDVTTIAREVAGQLQATAPGRHVEVAVDDDIEISGDGRLLRVVIENLLGNAMKFTSKHDHARIEIRARKTKDEVGFYVRDDGAGFDMTRADGRLFRPFQRLHSNSEFDGTGIGLATVARIVERHHGRVWAESEVEKGTTVYVAFPRSGPQRDARYA